MINSWHSHAHPHHKRGQHLLRRPHRTPHHAHRTSHPARVQVPVTVDARSEIKIKFGKFGHLDGHAKFIPGAKLSEDNTLRIITSVVEGVARYSNKHVTRCDPLLLCGPRKMAFSSRGECTKLRCLAWPQAQGQAAVGQQGRPPHRVRRSCQRIPQAGAHLVGRIVAHGQAGRPGSALPAPRAQDQVHQPVRRTNEKT